jgi:hypothetical protein
VPYDELEVLTSFGDTPVIASGSDAGAPPIVFPHALYAF